MGVQVPWWPAAGVVAAAAAGAVVTSALTASPAPTSVSLQFFWTPKAGPNIASLIYES